MKSQKFTRLWQHNKNLNVAASPPLPALILYRQDSSSQSYVPAAPTLSILKVHQRGAFLVPRPRSLQFS